MAEEINLKINTNIKDAGKDVDKLADGLTDAVDKTEDLTKATKEGGKGFKGLTGAVKSLGTGLKALGVGLILAAFTQLKEIFGQNQKVVDTFKTTTEFLSIAFNDFFNFISNNIGTVTGFFKDLFENPKERINELKDAIKQGLIDRFNEFVEVLGLAGKAFGQFVKGEFDAAFDTIKEAGKQVVDVYKIKKIIKRYT